MYIYDAFFDTHRSYLKPLFLIVQTLSFVTKVRKDHQPDRGRMSERPHISKSTYRDKGCVKLKRLLQETDRAKH